MALRLVDRVELQRRLLEERIRLLDPLLEQQEEEQEGDLEDEIEPQGRE